MAQTLVNVRMDEEVKKKMEETCKELGITMSTAFNIFARKMSRERRIPFEVSIDPFYSESNKKAIEESIQQLKNKIESLGESLWHKSKERRIEKVRRTNTTRKLLATRYINK